jgi:hypothetical protein
MFPDKTAIKGPLFRLETGGLPYLLWQPEISLWTVSRRMAQFDSRIGRS